MVYFLGILGLYISLVSVWSINKTEGQLDMKFSLAPLVPGIDKPEFS